MVLVALAGCSSDTPPGTPGTPGDSPGSGNQPPPGPDPEHGIHHMSDLQGEPGGERIWFVHDSVANIFDPVRVSTTHLAVYVPARLDVFDVLDLTGTVAKQIVPLGNGRVLFVAQRGTDRDVLVLLDAVARRPIAQRTHPGDRSEFRVSATGRAVIALDKADGLLHLIDAATLFDQPLPAIRASTAVFAPDQDVLYGLHDEGITTSTLQRYDLRTVDLGVPIGPPEAAGTIQGSALSIDVSPDGAGLAISSLPSSEPGQLRTFTLIDLAAGAASTLAADDAFGFTRDRRAILWRNGAGGHDLVFVPPATGVPSAPVALHLAFPQVRPLRQHDLLVVHALLVALPAPSFLLRIPDGARTEVSGLAPSARLFERPGHDELWVEQGRLARLDLATGKLDTIVGDASDARSAVFRADADEVVLGTDGPSLLRVSMATGARLGTPIRVTDPNDFAAPYRLADD